MAEALSFDFQKRKPLIGALREIAVFSDRAIANTKC